MRSCCTRLVLIASLGQLTSCNGNPYRQGGRCADIDHDGVCDGEDRCLGGQDSLDSDQDGVPDYCDCDAAGCAVHAQCTESYVGARCTCQTGYFGDATAEGSGCRDIDECASATHNCHEGAICSNSEGSYTCACQDGYWGDGTQDGIGCLPNLIANPGFEDDLNDWDHSHYHEDPALNDGTEEVVSAGCYNGKCLKMNPGNSSWQGTSQLVGMLEPGNVYLFGSRYKSSSTHRAFINLHDRDWQDASCEIVHLSNTVFQQGNDDWQSLQLMIYVPETDPCSSVADHSWRVYLYGHDPSNAPSDIESDIFYDDSFLVRLSAWPASDDMEEHSEWATTNCQLYSDTMPVVPCHDTLLDYSTEEKLSGEGALLLFGTREKRESHTIIYPTKPNTLYELRLHLKIEHRLTYNYLDLDYPASMVQQNDNLRDAVDLTRGIWSGRYDIKINNTSVLPRQAKDSTYRCASDIDWFEEEIYFKTTANQLFTRIAIILTGYEGNLSVDAVSVKEVDSPIDAHYFHVPIEVPFQGMRITNVSPSPLRVETNAAEFSFSDTSIILSKNGADLSHIDFRPGFLSNLTVTQETGTVFAENDHIMLSIGADSVLLTKLKDASAVTVRGIRPSSHNFEAGIIFATDYEKGVLFSPLRPQAEVRSMPNVYDSARVRYTYYDEDFDKLGLKFWNVISDFDSQEWRIQYQYQKGDGFLAQVFPPKDFDRSKFCKERMHMIYGDTINQPLADIRYDLQEANTKVNVGLVWLSRYAKSQNDLDPPEEYCQDAAGTYVHCHSPNVAKRVPLIMKADVSGPYLVGEPQAFRSLVTEAHRRGMRVIVYMTPHYYYTSDVDRFLGNLKEIIDQYGIDGVYYDGLYKGDVLRSLEMVRKTRNLLGNKFLALHLSWNRWNIWASDRFRLPFLDAYGDLVWNGEGVKSVEDDTWTLNFCGKNVSNTASMVLSELRPVDYSASREESIALTLSPEEQIDRILACDGVFSTSSYGVQSAITDKRFQYKTKFDTDLFLERSRQECLTVTCPDGECDLLETPLSCPEDCRPVSGDVALHQAGDLHQCQSASTVAQWILDDAPLYLLHYTFDDELITDVSGFGNHPSYLLGKSYQPPLPAAVDGRQCYAFSEGKSLFGDTGKTLDLTNRNFSAMARVKVNATGNDAERQVIFGIDPQKMFYFGLYQSKAAAFAVDGTKAYGIEEIVTEGCYAGKCLLARPHDATYQGIYQHTTLQPGKTYLLSARFKTVASHDGFINLHNPSWKDASCRKTGKGFSIRIHGDGDWQTIETSALIPTHDDCDEPIDPTWNAILYGSSPAGEGSDVYYDDIQLVDIELPGVNLLNNPGFEHDFDSWLHSNTIAPQQIVGTTDLLDEAWHSIGVVYDRANLRLYVDGVEEAKTAIPLREFDRLGRFFVGSYQPGGTRYRLDGFIDDLIVTSIALSDQQVAQYHLNMHHELSYSGATNCVIYKDGAYHSAR